jgi:hypothetical protein
MPDIQTKFFFRVIPPGSVLTDQAYPAAAMAAFVADYNDFAASLGYPPPFPDGVLQSVQMGSDFRFDFDPLMIDDGVKTGTDANGMPIMSSDPRGWHLNARMTPLPGGDAIVETFSTAILAYFASLPTYTNTAPTVPSSGVGGQVWHTTPRGTILISPAPVNQRRFP